jgi:hypothetical protein
MPLEPEQVDFLRELAEAARSAARDDRLFILMPTWQGALLRGPVERQITDTERHDLQDFVNEGFLRVREQNVTGSFTFTVAPEAHASLAEEAAREPLRTVEDQIVARYIEEAAFRERHPASYAKWADPDAELTTIGHKTREAVQEFATELVNRDGIEDVDPHPMHTAARLRAVINHHRNRLGEARRELLDALVAYWGEVIDLLERQEHGGQKEGEPLSWEDGRRAVFQTAVVMYEIDRTI